MGTSALKSAPITSLDSTPPNIPTAGAGSSVRLKEADGFVTTVAADAAGSTYRLVRLPSNAIVKHIFFESEAQGAGKVQLSAYYSDSTADGTAPANQGLVIPSTGAGFFSGDIDCSAAVTSSDRISGGTYDLSKRQKRLWDALGLTSDPGGFIDLVAVVHTTAITTGAARLGATVQYAD